MNDTIQINLLEVILAQHLRTIDLLYLSWYLEASRSLSAMKTAVLITVDVTVAR